MNEDAERRCFEEWARGYELNLSREQDGPDYGSYSQQLTRVAWDAWLESAARGWTS